MVNSINVNNAFCLLVSLSAAYSKQIGGLVVSS